VISGKSPSRLALTGVAAAALLLGHWTAYVLAYRQVRLRDVVLAQSGHSYLAPVGKLSFVLLFLSLAWLSIEACDRRVATCGTHAGFGSLWRRLICIQIVGFSLLELVERAITHGPLLEMFGHYTYALGLLLQVITALLAAVVVFLAARTVARACLLICAGRRRVRAGTRVARRGSPAGGMVLRRGLVSAIGVRGPPQAFLT
jgi:hypothetical protein